MGCARLRELPGGERGAAAPAPHPGPPPAPARSLRRGGHALPRPPPPGPRSPDPHTEWAGAGPGGGRDPSPGGNVVSSSHPTGLKPHPRLSSEERLPPGVGRGPDGGDVPVSAAEGERRLVGAAAPAWQAPRRQVAAAPAVPAPPVEPPGPPTRPLGLIPRSGQKTGGRGRRPWASREVGGGEERGCEMPRGTGCGEGERRLTLLSTPQSSTGTPSSVSGSSSEPEEFQLWLSDMET